MLFILWLNHTLCDVNNLYVCFYFIYVCNIDGNQPGILRNGMKPLPRQVLWKSLKGYTNSYQYFLVICKITLDLYVTDLDHLMIDLISLCFTVLNFKLIITIIESKLSGYFVDFTPILPALWPKECLTPNFSLHHHPWITYQGQQTNSPCQHLKKCIDKWKIYILIIECKGLILIVIYIVERCTNDSI